MALEGCLVRNCLIDASGILPEMDSEDDLVRDHKSRPELTTLSRGEGMFIYATMMHIIKR